MAISVANGWHGLCSGPASYIMLMGKRLMQRKRGRESLLSVPLSGTVFGPGHHQLWCQMEIHRGDDAVADIVDELVREVFICVFVRSAEASVLRHWA